MEDYIQKDQLKQAIGKYCKACRVEVLNISLYDFASKAHINYKTLSGFENGRSSNMFYFLLYFHMLPSEGARADFMDQINIIITNGGAC